MNWKIIIALTLLTILLAGCIDGGGGGTPDGGETPDGGGTQYDPSAEAAAAKAAIESELKAEGIDVINVTVAGKTIELSYNQSTEAELDDIYASWAFIFGTCVKNAPAGDASSSDELIVSIVCNFDDGEKMKVSSNAADILSFLNDEMGTWDFVYNLKTETLTKGPQVPEE